MKVHWYTKLQFRSKLNSLLLCNAMGHKRSYQGGLKIKGFKIERALHTSIMSMLHVYTGYMNITKLIVTYFLWT